MGQRNTTELVTSMLSGSRVSLARLITMVEEGSSDSPQIEDLIRPHLRKVYRIGITGPTGAGKSTIIDRLITIIRGNGLSVGIILVDPSSAITGGAVLGDRIRMQQHYLDEGVFIRSMATRGSYGGLSKAVETTAKLLDASGKDLVIIETTGVGQTDVSITEIADTVVVVLVPGFGDSIQLMKAGLVEIADIVVVNKADYEGAENLVSELRDTLSLNPKHVEPSIIKTEATNNIGVEELYYELGKRKSILSSQY